MSPVPTYPSRETEIDLTRQALQPGTYTFKLVDVAQGDGPSGYPYLRWTVTVCDEGAMHDQVASLILSLSPQTRWKMDEFLDAIGAPLSGRVKTLELLGKFFKADVEMGEDKEGRLRPQLINLRPVLGPVARPVANAATPKAPVATPDAEGSEASEDVGTPTQAPELRKGAYGAQPKLPF